MSLHQGNRLKSILERKGENLVQLAANLGVSRSTLYNYFEQEEIPRKKLLKICEAAGIDGSELNPANILNEDSPLYKGFIEKIRILEDQVRAKDIIILQQSEMIEMLKVKMQRLRNRKK